jgi:uncharacterized protein (DUF302 family)
MVSWKSQLMGASMPGSTSATPHQVNRLTIATGAEYGEFRERYQRAVPAVPQDDLTALARRGASWPEMLDWVDSIAPLGFLIYFRIEIDQAMGLAGHRTRGTEYLMGNHTIAERMFRHDPAVMLHAPLRTFLWQGPDGTASLAIDQPSTVFASYRRPEITEVGQELDRKVAALLEHLDAPVPAELRAS